VRRFALWVIAILAFPSVAAAKNHTVAPPGNSAVQQYVETFPTANGGQPTNSVHHGGGPGESGRSGGSGGPGGSAGGSGSGASGSSVIPAATQQALRSQGSEGRAAAAVLGATAPSGVGHLRGGGSAKASAPASPGGGISPTSAVVKALTGSGSGGGLGVLLPIILVSSLLLASVLGILRHRRHTA